MRCDALSALSTVGKCALLHYLMCEACCEPAKHEVGGTTLVILLFLAFLLHLLCPFTASFHKPYYTPTPQPMSESFLLFQRHRLQ